MLVFKWSYSSVSQCRLGIQVQNERLSRVTIELAPLYPEESDQQKLATLAAAAIDESESNFTPRVAPARRNPGLLSVILSGF